MPTMHNTLNVSQLLKRLGVVGESQSHAALLDQLRMVVNISDLSRLVPPLVGPVGSSSSDETSAVGSFNKWSLQARSQGGLQVLSMSTSGVPSLQKLFLISITSSNPFGALTTIPNQNFSFGQVAESIFSVAPHAGHQLGSSAVEVNALYLDAFAKNIWLGPGQFLNVESNFANNTETLQITWAEYTGALNP